MFTKRRRSPTGYGGIAGSLSRRVLLNSLIPDRKMRGHIRKLHSKILIRRSLFKPRVRVRGRRRRQRRAISTYKGVFSGMRRTKRLFRRRARRKGAVPPKTASKKRGRISILRRRAKVRPNPLIRRLKRLQSRSRSKKLTSPGITYEKRLLLTLFAKSRATNFNIPIAGVGVVRAH
jgi:hypothetical protein